MYVETTALKKLLKLKKRIRGIQGGTSASKTISIIQILIDIAQCEFDKSKTISITSESVPHLKRGAMRDFKDIMKEHGYWNDKNWNATDFIYEYETGNKIEFFSLDQPHKVRGPRREILFINEANNIPYETFDQLEVRTNEVIWLDWNPVAPFWWHEAGDDHEAVSQREDAESLILTYRDNEGLPETIVRSIEQRRGNKNWFRVYGEGLLGEVEGRIYTGWQIMNDIPPEARLERYGLDFGYSVDPTAIVAVYRYNNSIILDEMMYQKGLSNKDIADLLLNYDRALVVADSAEPKSINEIGSYGVPIVGAKKGRDSIEFGIQKLQYQRVFVTKRSTNLLKEYRGYIWEQNTDGRWIRKPIQINDHLLDAARYAVVHLFPQPVKPPKTIFDQMTGQALLEQTGIARRIKMYSS